MKYLNLFIPCAAMILFHACKKNPEACISASKTTVAVNEEFSISSCSKEADRYFWTIDTTVVKLISPETLDNCTSYMVIKFLYPGEYVISLQALTYKGVKLNCNVGTGLESDETSVAITVQ